MQTLSVAEARKVEAVGKEVKLQGWVRTRRDSKGGFSFLELNDGSCLGNVQVIADGSLANYETEVKKLHAGASVTVTGLVISTRSTSSFGRGEILLPTDVRAVARAFSSRTLNS